MPSLVVAAATRFCGTTLSVMWSVPQFLNSPRSPLSWRSLASFSLRGLLTLEVPTPAFVSRLAPRLLLLLVVVLLMSGFPWVCPVSLRLGTSRSRPCSALLISPRLPRRLLIFFMRAPPLRWPSVGPPLSRFSLEACGGDGGRRGWSQAFRAVVSWIASEGFSSDIPRDISLRIAQSISCTLHRENARAILGRSPGSVGGSTGLVGDLVSSSGW